MRLTRKETQRQTRDKLLAAAHSSIVEEGVAASGLKLMRQGLQGW